MTSVSDKREEVLHFCICVTTNLKFLKSKWFQEVQQTF